MYFKILKRTEPDRDIYLAVRELAFVTIFEDDVGKLVLEDGTVRLLVFDDKAGGRSMGTVDRYRKIVREVLTPYTSIQYANADIQNELVCDPETDRYLVVSVGWGKVPKGRMHGCLIHLDIIDGKIWIQQRDGTEHGVALELEEAGVPRSDIVLGFHPPDVRPYTDYAAA